MEANSVRKISPWLILAVVLMAEVMDLLDSTVVNVAAPSIHRDLATSSTALQWIVGGYSLALAVGLIAGGRLGDIAGRRRMFLIGTVGFTLASMLCGLAPDTAVLIAARLLQGLAAAVMLPQGFGIIREVFAPEDTAKAFGMFGPVIGLAAVVGPVVGGALVGANLWGTGWRLVFFVNAPVGVAAVIGAWLLLPRTRLEAAARFDLLGTLLSGVASFALIYPLIEGRELGWPVWVFLLLAGSIVLYAAFGWQQRSRTRRGADPLVVSSVFRNRGYSGGLIVLTAFFAGIGGMLLCASLFLQAGQHFSAIHTGVTFIPMSLGMAVGAVLSGAWLGPRLGRTAVAIGGLVSAIGWALVLLAVHSYAAVSAVDLLPGLAIGGVGTGIVAAPLFDIIISSVSDAETGSASGLLNAVQQLATAIGVAVFGTVFFSAATHTGFGVAMQRVSEINIASLVAMIALTWLMPRRMRESTTDGPTPSDAKVDSAGQVAQLERASA